MPGNVFGERFMTADESLEKVRNIFCIGRNYTDHALELGNAVPESPLVFGKPTHALTPAKGNLTLPKDRTNIHHELEIVLYIQATHVPGTELAKSVGAGALGLDLTDRDAQNRLKAAGQPWEYAKGFASSAVITDFRTVQDWNEFMDTAFSLQRNGKVVQEGRARDMLFSMQTLLDFIATHFTLKAGDIVYTGTPAGVGPLESGDELLLSFAGELWGECRVTRG